VHADHRSLRRPIVLEEVEIALLRLEREACATACAEAAHLRLALALRRDLHSSVEEGHRPDAHLQDWRLRTAALVQACLMSEHAAPAVLQRAFAAEVAQWPLASELAIAAWELLPNEAHQALVVHTWLAEGRPEEASAWSQSLAANRCPAGLSSVTYSGHMCSGHKEVAHGTR